MKHSAAGVCALLALGLLSGCEIGVERPVEPAAERGAVSSGQPSGSPAANDRIARGRLRFVEGYRKGYAQAIGPSKPMLVFFTAEWCRFCHQMADEAFTHPQVVSLSEHFVCILVDADAEPDVCQQFEVSGYPTVQFLSPRGAPLQRIVGKQPGRQLMMAMHAALQSVARRGTDELQPH